MAFNFSIPGTGVQVHSNKSPDIRLSNALRGAHKPLGSPPRAVHPGIEFINLALTSNPATSQAHVYLTLRKQDARQLHVPAKPCITSWEQFANHILSTAHQLLNKTETADWIGRELNIPGVQVLDGRLGLVIRETKQLFDENAD